MAIKTDAEIIDAVKKTKGLLTVAARRLGVTRKTLHNRMTSSEAVREAVVEARDHTTDIAESELFKAVKKGEAWAVCFYLKCQAKERGYVERKEVTGAKGGPIEINAAEIQRRLTSRITDLANRVGAGGFFDEPSGNGEDGP